LIFTLFLEVEREAGKRGWRKDLGIEVKTLAC
jgi:hypothetical protein